MPPKEPGRPRANTSKPGDILQPGPESFRTEEEAREAARQFWESSDRLLTMRAKEREEEARAIARGDNDDEDVSVSETGGDDDSGDEDYVPGPEKKKRPSTSRPKGKGRAADVPADQEMPEVIDDGKDEGDEGGLIVDHDSEVTDSDIEGDLGEDNDEVVEADENTLALDSPGWKFGNPVGPPLTYYVHSDAAGNMKANSIKFAVDFASRESVNKANKTRRLEVNRAKARHGFKGPLKRPSTKGREYTKENDKFLGTLHHNYSIEAGGKRIPFAELTRRYNQKFPAENRSQASISSHINNTPELKNMRNSYTTGGD